MHDAWWSMMDHDPWCMMMHDHWWFTMIHDHHWCMIHDHEWCMISHDASLGMIHGWSANVSWGLGWKILPPEIRRTCWQTCHESCLMMHHGWSCIIHDHESCISDDHDSLWIISDHASSCIMGHDPSWIIMHHAWSFITTNHVVCQSVLGGAPYAVPAALTNEKLPYGHLMEPIWHTPKSSDKKHTVKKTGLSAVEVP